MENPSQSGSEIHRIFCQMQISRAFVPSLSTTNRFLKRIALDRLGRAKLLSDRAEQAERDEVAWMQSLTQGRVSESQIVSEFSSVLPIDDINKLYCSMEKGLRFYRRRTAVFLAFKKGIKRKSIERFFKIGPNYIRLTNKYYQEHGVSWFQKHKRKAPLKYEQEHYKNAVFAILHSPPSAHGMNRTTWRIADIKDVISSQGLPLSKHGISNIIHKAGYTLHKAKVVLTSNDPNYEKKVAEIVEILAYLKPDERFFSIDEYGPFAVKSQGGWSWMKKGETKTIPQFQKSKGVLIVTAAAELSENQITHFYSEKKNTGEMLKLLEVLLKKYSAQSCLFLSWDAASWHLSKRLYARVEEINSSEYQAAHKCPKIKLAPLPSRAQFLNVIESIFSGMAKAVIHNSNYQSLEECKIAIDRHFLERNQHFIANPQRAGGKIWGKELVIAKFHNANNCKNPKYR